MSPTRQTVHNARIASQAKAMAELVAADLAAADAIAGIAAQVAALSARLDAVEAALIAHGGDRKAHKDGIVNLTLGGS